ncbi:hypothetical protein LSTR_LSTR004852 [Laodelphax striatellus]|uniref:Uncharacterized protein n=1 Tax=Laodelphax striatellus TaxID=195883 RepID=A0A482WIW1_LAOST|nr:hypothetical protein LSTR_LSTR004852 [Laodelphax striatellus]
MESSYLEDYMIELAGRLKVLNRLTVRLSDPSQYVKVSQSENLKKYHLLAVTPLSENAFQHLCHTLDVDIITLSPAEKNLRFNRKLYNLAVSKNMYFELSYGPALNSSANRRDLIQLSHTLHGVGKSKIEQVGLLAEESEAQYSSSVPQDLLFFFLSECASIVPHPLGRDYELSLYFLRILPVVLNLCQSRISLVSCMVSGKLI